MNRHPRLLLTMLGCLLALTTGARAQSALFDMSPERPATPAAPATPAIPPLLSRPRPAVVPEPSVPQAPAPTVTVAPAAPVEAPVSAAPAPVDATSRHYLVPSASLVLEGEYDRRGWSIYLMDAEANTPAKLHLSFRNAVVIAPEVSELQVLINGHPLAQERIAAADAPTSLLLDIPAGVLQAGANRMELVASQRHRTDCDIRSTYDLWTEIDPKATYLSFASNTIAPLSVAEAIRAVGVDETGKTQFKIWMPGLSQSNAASAVMRLVQGMSLLGSMPNQSVQFTTSAELEEAPGQLGLIIGVWSELQPLVPDLPETARAAGLATILPASEGRGRRLLISGPSWDAISTAIETLIASTDLPINVRRDVIDTQRWREPSAPILFGGEVIQLSQLGVETVEFSGRRLRTSFSVAIPADFYASAYGEATLLLDAAFTPEVKPGSHIDIYINGNIASTLPIKTTDGGVFSQLPVKIPLRHIRAGVNEIWIEVALETDADVACMPGTPAGQNPRFALFDSSQWVMPQFARLAQIPNLSGMASVGRYSADPKLPLLLSIDHLEADTLGAAATFIGKMALTAGRLSQVEMVTATQALGERPALFVGTIAQMPPKLLTQIGVSPSAVNSWRPQMGGPATQNVGTIDAMDKWRQQVSGGEITDALDRLRGWIGRRFDISLESLSLLPEQDEVFQPSSSDTLLIGQGQSPQHTARWTAIVAPTPAELLEGVTGLAQQDKWQLLNGRMTSYRAKIDEVTNRPAHSIAFVQTVAPSFSNYRLVAANWLSTNILFYSAAVVGLSSLLGLATMLMLSRMGRRS
jgi:cellulose synthase operon protein B